MIKIIDQKIIPASDNWLEESTERFVINAKTGIITYTGFDNPILPRSK